MVLVIHREWGVQKVDNYYEQKENGHIESYKIITPGQSWLIDPVSYTENLRSNRYILDSIIIVPFWNNL